jgi:hypothetical protein
MLARYSPSVSPCVIILGVYLFYKNQVSEIRAIIFLFFYKIISTYDYEYIRKILGEHLAFLIKLLNLSLFISLNFLDKY